MWESQIQMIWAMFLDSGCTIQYAIICGFIKSAGSVTESDKATRYHVTCFLSSPRRPCRFELSKPQVAPARPFFFALTKSITS